MNHADVILDKFDRLSVHLEQRGFPPTSPWWREEIQRWYRSGKRQLVARVGRRGGKSSTLSRLAVVEALYGLHKVPPGDIGVVAVVSTRAPEAAERLRTITAILDALGIKYKPSKGVEGVELLHKRVAFRVHVATLAGVSGFTGIFLLLDEVAKWRDLDTGLNPGSEVIKSVRPTVATQPNARIAIISSPLGKMDAHYDEYIKGDTDLQTTAHAASWVANPTLTEADTHALEPDDLVWAREYGAIPQAENESSLLTSSLLDKAIDRKRHEPDERYRYVAAMDPATRGNAWTLVVTTRDPDDRRRVVLTKEWRGTRTFPLVPGTVFREIKTLIDPYKISHVWSDQYARDALREIGIQCGVHLNIEPWTAPLKADAYEALKSLLQEGKLAVPDDAVLRQDLLGIRVRITRQGMGYDLASQGARHSDFAPAVAMALLHTRVRAYEVPKELSLQEKHQQMRDSWLKQRTKDRERKERFGQRPVTHRAQ